ncbi:MAG: hypothetical protein AB2754_15900 [Candidatus Thiodiazotropha endolucinida]
MDIKAAAIKTREIVLDAYIWPTKPEKLGRLHVAWMLDQIESGQVSGEKAHRWLGWAQAAVVHANAGTLDEMKHINKAA